MKFSGYVDRDDLKEWQQNFRASELHGMYRDFPDGGPTGDGCSQTTRSYPAYPGIYNLTAGCVSCVFAEYRVTAARLPATGSDTAGLVALGLGLCLVGACAIAMVSAAPSLDAVNAAR